MANLSPLLVPAGSDAAAFVDQAGTIGYAALRLGDRVIRILRGQDAAGRELLQRPGPLEPEWSHLLAPLHDIEPLLRRVAGAAWDPIKAKLRAIGQRVNRCSEGLRRCGENPLWELGPEFHTDGWNLGEDLKAIQVIDPPAVPWAEDGGEENTTDVLQREARALWERDPVLAFERLRDRTAESVQCVADLYQSSLGAAAEQPWARVSPEIHECLRHALHEAQAFWSGTPVARYLDRPDEPVYLTVAAGGSRGRVAGSCYHDLGMSLANGVRQSVEQAQLAADYVRLLRSRTAAGDEVAQKVVSLIPHIRCECQKAITRWRADTAGMTPTARGSNSGGDSETADSSERAAEGPARDERADLPLSERQLLILQALAVLKAFTWADRQTTAAIAERAEGIEANPEAFKQPIADLKRRDLVDTKAGRGGGCWLTPAGRALLARLGKR